MEHEFIFVDSSLVIHRSFGPASVQGFVDGVEALTSHPNWRQGIDEIGDLTQLETSQITASDIEGIAAGQAKYSDEIGSGRVAVVVGRTSPTRYGLTRMFEMLIEPLVEAKLRSFWTIDEALEWLRGPEYSLPAKVRKELSLPAPRAKT